MCLADTVGLSFETTRAAGVAAPKVSKRKAKSPSPAKESPPKAAAGKKRVCCAFSLWSCLRLSRSAICFLADQLHLQGRSSPKEKAADEAPAAAAPAAPAAGIAFVVVSSFFFPPFSCFLCSSLSLLLGGGGGLGVMWLMQYRGRGGGISEEEEDPCEEGEDCQGEEGTRSLSHSHTQWQTHRSAHT